MYLRATVSMHADRLLHVGNVDDRLLAPGDTSLSDKLLGLFTKFGVVIAVTVRHSASNARLKLWLSFGEPFAQSVPSPGSRAEEARATRCLVVRMLFTPKFTHLSGGLGRKNR